MSNNRSSPPRVEPSQFTTPAPHDFVLLAIALQGIAQVLLNHGTATKPSDAYTSMPKVNMHHQECLRQSAALQQTAQILLNNQHYSNLHEYIDDIYLELSIIMNLLDRLNENTSTSPLELHVLRNQLAKPLGKLEELSLQVKASNMAHVITRQKLY